MGQISFDNPVPGQSDSTEEPKIVTALTTLRDLVNGRLDKDNLAASAGILDTQLGGNTLSGTYKTAVRIPFADDGLSVQSYVACINGVLQFVGSTFGYSNSPNIFSLSQPSTLMPTGRSLSMRLYAIWGSNSVVHPGDITFSLVPVSIAGAATALSVSIGAAVSGSSVVVRPQANTIVEAFGSAFTAANTWYAISVTPSSTGNSNSLYCGAVELQYRYV